MYTFHELHMFGQHVIVHQSDTSKIQAQGLPGQYLGPDEFSLGVKCTSALQVHSTQDSRAASR